MSDLPRQGADGLAARARSSAQRQIDCTGPASWAHSPEEAVPQAQGRAPRQTLPLLDPPARAAS